MKKEQLKEAVGELNLVDTVFEDGGGSYIDTAVSVMQVLNLIDQLDELNRPLVVPKELGEWLARQRLGNEGSFFIIIIELEDMWLGSSFEEFITDNKKQLIEVIIGNRDYEIEKEKLYVVELSNDHLTHCLAYDLVDKVFFISQNREEKLNKFKKKFTEQEIKDYDPRFMAFAVEVSE